MRVFVAGATGAIGRPLVSELVAAGHRVGALTRSTERAVELAGHGIEPIVSDIYARDLVDRVSAFEPDVVIHQVTGLPSREYLVPLRLLRLNKARTRGTDALIAAAREAGAKRFIAQSVAFELPGIAQRAVRHLEDKTLGYPGIVARYGHFYGPRTWSETAPKNGPVVHVETAAAATVALLSADPGIYEVTDEGARALG